MSRIKEKVVLVVEAENHASAQAQDVEARGGWEESEGVSLFLVRSGSHCPTIFAVGSHHGPRLWAGRVVTRRAGKSSTQKAAAPEC